MFGGKPPGGGKGIPFGRFGGGGPPGLNGGNGGMPRPPGSGIIPGPPGRPNGGGGPKTVSDGTYGSRPWGLTHLLESQAMVEESQVRLVVAAWDLFALLLRMMM